MRAIRVASDGVICKPNAGVIYTLQADRRGMIVEVWRETNGYEPKLTLPKNPGLNAQVVRLQTKTSFVKLILGTFEIYILKQWSRGANHENKPGILHVHMGIAHMAPSSGLYGPAITSQILRRIRTSDRHQINK